MSSSTPRPLATSRNRQAQQITIDFMLGIEDS